ncbi:MAG: hypothetical protein AAGG68_17005 [Bacteroidota bacterium]
MRILLLGLLLLSLIYPKISLYAQDTLITNYPNSSSEWHKIYQQDQKVAENIYHENGQEWMTVKYAQKGKQNWKWYYENGNPYFEATYINDLLQGTYKIWYENGQLAEQLIFKDHVENGFAIFFHANGQVAMKGYYEEGKMVGKWEFYDENGDLPSGIWEWSFAAALEKIRVKGRLEDGQPIGKWRYKGTANQGLASQLVFEEMLDNAND